MDRRLWHDAFALATQQWQVHVEIENLRAVEREEDEAHGRIITVRLVIGALVAPVLGVVTDARVACRVQHQRRAEATEPGREVAVQPSSAGPVAIQLCAGIGQAMLPGCAGRLAVRVTPSKAEAVAERGIGSIK